MKKILCTIKTPGRRKGQERWFPACGSACLLNVFLFLTWGCLNCSILGSSIELQNPCCSWDGRYCKMALICFWPLDTTEKWLESKHWGERWAWCNDWKCPQKDSSSRSSLPSSLAGEFGGWEVQHPHRDVHLAGLVMGAGIGIGIGLKSLWVDLVVSSPHYALQKHIFRSTDSLTVLIQHTFRGKNLFKFHAF